AYNMPGALRLRGRLHVAALRASLDGLVRRHEALRTVFAEQDGAPVQVIQAAAPVALPVVDLRGVPEAEREPEAERLAAEEALRPFDLARGPLLRSTLVRLGGADHVLLITLHHVVSDGWSMGVLVREVSALYAAYGRGEEPRLPELAVQYADYAVWQRGWLSGEVLEAQIRFWKEKLAGAPPLLGIPTDRPRAAGRSARAASHRFELPAAVSRELRALSRREGATLFMTLLAAWQALLGRYAGQEDVVVGSPIAGRSRRETEGLVGFFVNMLALRTELEGDPSWRELVGRVREGALGAYEHQELPFERLVEELEVERSLAHTPVFQVTFALERSPAQDVLALGDLAVERFGGGGGVGKFDLDLTLEDGGETLAGALVYRAALWDAETVGRLAGHLELLLEAMAADPTRRVAEISLLRDAERVQVLESWNATAAPYPPACVHELVAAQAARTPCAAAVVFRGETLSYAELESRANRLAHHLRRLGVGPETRVGVCLERTLELVVALLAVLKAGGAYVPLDPAYPRERLGWMQEDAGVALVLTSSALAGVLPTGTRGLALDAARAAVDAEPDGAPEPGVLPENLSHVIFTSGSTGRPKGVMIRHSSVVVLLHWLREAVSDEERASVLFSTSINFDVSVAEVFGTLAWGGKLVLVENALELSALEEPVVCASMVPTAAAVLLRMGGIPACVRTLNLGGEALPNDLAQALYALGTVEKVGNLYGPTEDTTYSTYSLVERGAERVLVGRPVAGTQAYVLDGEMQPGPVGVVGELYLAGEGLSRGYAGRPELTAERYLPNPFAAPGSRMYRVMDRVRWHSTGELEYLGRTDFQVKVRGFRIELGEIEAALRSHPAVREAAAVVREDASGAPGDRRIVAYVVPVDGAAPAAAEMRVHVKARLPEYMVPSAFVSLETLPLNPNGKLDRRALPAPEASQGGGYVAPRTPTEELLAGIFAEVLGLAPERVGARDDFFELGGHSLLATRAASRARVAFGVEVPLRAIFEAPTVAALAAEVDALLRAGAGTAAPPVVPVPRDPLRGLPLSFAQQRLWFIDRLQPGSAAYNIPAAMRIRGALDVGALRRAFTEVVRRHEALRTVLVDEGGEAMQVILPAAPVPLPVLDFSGLAGETRQAEALRRPGEEGRRPFDLSRGPLLRVALARLGEEEWLLCLTMHHVVGDGWSIVVLARELSTLYVAYREGRESPLPELPVQYADYAVWQREWLRGEVLEAQLRYWREQLEGAPPLLELPTDHLRRGGPGAAEASRGFAVPAGVTRALRGLGRRESATLFMTLLAGWQSLLGRYAGQEDVVVGTPVAGRSRAEVEGLIGFFVNTLVMRADLGGDPTFRELLGRLREAALGAYQHQEVPFEKLVEELGVERSLAQTPLFQVMFVLQNNERAVLELGHATLERVESGTSAARFDLSLHLEETDRGIEGALSYRRELWDAGTMARLLDQFGHLLEQVAAYPERRLSELSLLRAAEREQVLAAWNATAAPYPRERCLHELFAEQAALTPDVPAVVFGAEVLTYAELDRRSNHVAHVLRRSGAGPEVRVALCLERGPDQLVALLAALKAGGAYVPLDPAYPTERLASLIEDAGAPVVLTRSHLRDRLPASGAEVLCLDESTLQGESDVMPTSGVAPENLAYVIYTSGSTGRPKGVLVQHRSVVNLSAALREAVYSRRGTAASPRVSLNGPLTFDTSVKQWVQLLHGATLCPVPEEIRYDAEALSRFLRECEVDVFDCTPAQLRMLVGEGLLEGPGRTPTDVLVAGEAIEAPLWERLVAMEERRFWNLYGPTECTVDAALSRVEGERPRIGRAVANAQTYVLDEAGEPAPVGIPGELYVGGAGVARGYLGRPELTAERFLPDPFSGEAGARLYRTGDRVRWLASGELEYLGRTDFQVKVRGFRVEPEEIEAALRGHPGVRDAVVLAREDAPGRTMLVAYLVPTGEGGAALVDELRTHLRERLPEQMVPADFVLLDSLPLSPSGKVDRRARPAPERSGGGREGGAPLTATERALAAIWEEALGVRHVGVGDNFFDLGGHSLLLAQVHSRLQERFPDRVALVDLFTHRTLGALATRLDRGGPPITPRAPQVRKTPAAPD
ncbi:MAG TPA: amino acid adenylation domain-containing protein, partial [Longimicrobiaceae bacterium]|nr:amino acid adenylation domain-containing protein [Longimicrobiaceae bacterium]